MGKKSCSVILQQLWWSQMCKAGFKFQSVFLQFQKLQTIKVWYIKWKLLLEYSVRNVKDTETQTTNFHFQFNCYRVKKQSSAGVLNSIVLINFSKNIRTDLNSEHKIIDFKYHKISMVTMGSLQYSKNCLFINGYINFAKIHKSQWNTFQKEPKLLVFALYHLFIYFIPNIPLSSLCSILCWLQ